MSEFKWTGINANGQKVNGVIHTDNKKTAHDKLILSEEQHTSRVVLVLPPNESWNSKQT